jgi:hypothetical protein
MAAFAKRCGKQTEAERPTLTLGKGPPQAREESISEGRRF